MSYHYSNKPWFRPNGAYPSSIAPPTPTPPGSSPRLSNLNLQSAFDPRRRVPRRQGSMGNENERLMEAYGSVKETKKAKLSEETEMGRDAAFHGAEGRASGFVSNALTTSTPTAAGMRSHHFYPGSGGSFTVSPETPHKRRGLGGEMPAISRAPGKNAAAACEPPTASTTPPYRLEYSIDGALGLTLDERRELWEALGGPGPVEAFNKNQQAFPATASTAPTTPERNCCTEPQLTMIDYAEMICCCNRGSMTDNINTVGASRMLTQRCCEAPGMLTVAGFEFCPNYGTLFAGSDPIAVSISVEKGTDAAIAQLDRKTKLLDLNDGPSSPAPAKERLDSHVLPPPMDPFPKFMELPREIRERVYHFVLASDQPIAPHLCDERPGDAGYIKFHDENKEEHNATHIRTAITRVSQRVRSESLSIFYSANTFVACADLATYFDRLAHLGRFHMIRNVTFAIDFSRELMAPKALRDILQNISEQKAFEQRAISANLKQGSESMQQEIARKRKSLAGKKEAPPTKVEYWNDTRFNLIKAPTLETTSNGPSKPKTRPPLERFKPDLTQFYTTKCAVLKRHPQHVVGGLNWISTFLVLRKLASEFTSKSTTTPETEYFQKLVLHVPNAELFTTYDTLAYLPAICDGLGIKLHFVEGRDVEWGCSGIKLSWHQIYQKKDFHAKTVAQGANGQVDQKYGDLDAMSKRVSTMYPDLENMRRPTRNTYFRRNCKGTEIEWFSVDTAGGGHQ